MVSQIVDDERSAYRFVCSKETDTELGAAYHCNLFFDNKKVMGFQAFPKEKLINFDAINVKGPLASTSEGHMLVDTVLHMLNDVANDGIQENIMSGHVWNDSVFGYQYNIYPSDFNLDEEWLNGK